MDNNKNISSNPKYSYWQATNSEKNTRDYTKKKTNNCNNECEEDTCDRHSCNHRCEVCPVFRSFCEGPQGASGPQGPTGATGATGPTTQLRGLEVQLQGETATVATGTPVIFDTLISSQSPFISYNTGTGTITITQTGVYYINWWISTDGVDGGINLTFSIVTSAGDNIRASSPLVTGQIVGNALISVIASAITPVTLQLVNVTGLTVGYGITPIRADLTIMNVTF